MKKCLSLFLAVIFIFSVVPLSGSALGDDALDAGKSFKITESQPAENQITCTVSINENVSFCDAIIYVKYNKNAVKIVDAGACTKTAGGEEQNVPGSIETGEVVQALYEASDLYSEGKSVYAISYINSKNVTYNEEKDFIYVTFELVEGYTGKNNIDFIYARSIDDSEKQCFYTSTLNLADITDLSFVLNGDNNTYSISGCDETVTGTMEIPLEYDGKDVTGIAENAFSGCEKLTAFSVSADSTCFSADNGVLFNKDGTEIICFPGGKGSKYTVPESVTKIRSDAFPDSVTVSVYCNSVFASEEKYTVVHSYSDEWIIDKEATCVEDGSKSRCCEKCNEKSDVTVIPATGHDYSVEHTVEATCTESGTDTYTCSCGDSYTETVSALGHKFSSEWTVDVAPTSTTTGIKSHHCLRCDAVTDVTVIHASAPESVELNSVSNTTSGVEIKWSAVNGADNYTILRKVGFKKYQSVEVVSGDCTSFVDTTAESGTKYTYTVFASNESGDGEYDKTGLTIRFITAPVVKTSVTADGISVKWNETDGAEGYEVYRKAGSGSWAKVKTISDCSKVSYKDTSVKSGTKYSYYVKAYNGATYSSYKSTTAKLFLATPTVKTSNTSKGISVKWNKITGAKGYYVYRKAGSGKWTKVKEITSGSTVSFTDTTAKSGTKYSYYVKAYNGKTVSSYKASTTLMFLKTVKLSSASSGKSGVTVKWGKVTGAKGYYVYRKTGSGSYKKLATVKSGSTVKYVDKSAKKGTTYTYYVKAYNGSYTGSYSNTLKCKDKY